MPIKSGEFTPKEVRFIEHLVATGNAKFAAREAGYRQTGHAAWELTNRPAVQAEVARQSAERITNHLLPLAVNAIERLLVDPKTPAGATVQAAKLVMDRVYGDAAASMEKPPAEMTGEELAKALEQLRMQAARRSETIIDVTPETPSVFE